MAIEDRTTVPASQEKLHEVARCGGPRPGSFIANSLGNGEGWIITVIPSLYPPHKWVYPSPIRLRWIHPYPTRLSRMWIWATGADIHRQLELDCILRSMIDSARSRFPSLTCTTMPRTCCCCSCPPCPASIADSRTAAAIPRDALASACIVPFVSSRCRRRRRTLALPDSPPTRSLRLSLTERRIGGVRLQVPS